MDTIQDLNFKFIQGRNMLLEMKIIFKMFLRVVAHEYFDKLIVFNFIYL